MWRWVWDELAARLMCAVGLHPLRCDPESPSGWRCEVCEYTEVP